MVRRRWLALALIPVAIGAYLVLVPRYGQHEVQVALGARAAEVRQVELHFLRDGLVARDILIEFPDGAPPSIARELRLKNGDYQVMVRVRFRGGREAHVGRDFRTDAPETIDLSDVK